jgi:hypothetical protein
MDGNILLPNDDPVAQNSQSLIHKNPNMHKTLLKITGAEAYFSLRPQPVL